MVDDFCNGNEAVVFFHYNDDQCLYFNRSSLINVDINQVRRHFKDTQISSHARGKT